MDKPMERHWALSQSSRSTHCDQLIQRLPILYTDIRTDWRNWPQRWLCGGSTACLSADRGCDRKRCLCRGRTAWLTADRRSWWYWWLLRSSHRRLATDWRNRWYGRLFRWMFTRMTTYWRYWRQRWLCTWCFWRFRTEWRRKMSLISIWKWQSMKLLHQQPILYT